MNPKIGAVISKAGKWREEYEALRAIALSCPLTEELKWGWPCYTLGKRNVVLIHGFKDYCALLFFKGALLKDPAGILIRQTENVQSSRQIRFTGMHGILERQDILKAYILEAIEAERAGLKVEFKKTAEFGIPQQFQEKLNRDPAVKLAFEALAPGRQRAYLLHFGAPKLPKTRQSRIEKCVPLILSGKGLND